MAKAPAAERIQQERGGSILHVPASESAERAVLGAVLADGDCFRRVALMLDAEDFYADTHRAAFRAFVHLAAEHHAIDLLTLNDQLERSGTLGAAGGAAYVASLADGLPDPANVEHYAKIVREQSIRRAVLVGAQGLVASAGAGVGELDDLVSTVESLARTVRSADLASGGWKVPDHREFLSLSLPPRVMLYNPWLPGKGSAVVYGAPGVGKTRFLLGVAVCIAGGGSFLRGDAPNPEPVCYVDGELPGSASQVLLAEAIKAADRTPVKPVHVFSVDIQARPLPDVATGEGQRIVEDCLHGAKVLFLDNLSSLVRSNPKAPDNTTESWQAMQDWILALRRAGVSTVIADHSNRAGSQRGTGRKADIVDTLLALRRPEDWSPADGARFEVHFEKCRCTIGRAVEPFEAQLGEGPDGSPVWTVKDLEDRILARVVELKAEGLSTRAIGREVGRHFSSVSRLLRKAKEQGLV